MCTVFKKKKKDIYKYIRRWPFLHLRTPRTPPFISYLQFFLAVRAGLHRPVVGHVEAALPRPVRALFRAAERLPHPGGAWWEELGGSGRWVQRLVQLQASGETSWRYWSSPAGASDLAAGHLFTCDRPSDTIISTATVAVLLLVKHRAAVSVCALSLSTRFPGRCVPCLPDCPQERHPRRADCGHDVRWPGHKRGVSSVSFPPHNSATHLSHAFQFPSK